MVELATLAGLGVPGDGGRVVRVQRDNGLFDFARHLADAVDRAGALLFRVPVLSLTVGVDDDDIGVTAEAVAWPFYILSRDPSVSAMVRRFANLNYAVVASRAVSQLDRDGGGHLGAAVVSDGQEGSPSVFKVDLEAVLSDIGDVLSIALRKGGNAS